MNKGERNIGGLIKDVGVGVKRILTAPGPDWEKESKFINNLRFLLDAQSGNNRGYREEKWRELMGRVNRIVSNGQPLPNPEELLK